MTNPSGETTSRPQLLYGRPARPAPAVLRLAGRLGVYILNRKSFSINEAFLSGTGSMAEKRTRGPSSAPERDKLGKLFESYGTNVKAILLIVTAVMFGLGGGVILGASNFLAWRLAESTDGTPYALLGGVLMAIGPPVMAFAVYQFGRRFEVRRKGVRLVHRINVTELFWDEIDLIQVHKTTHVDQTGRRTGR